MIHLHITLQEKTDLMEEVLTEISVYLGMLYHLIEAFKGHDDFADELSTSFVQYVKITNVILVSLDPPLPVYIFTVVAGLREKNAKGYPIKKVVCYQRVFGLIQLYTLNPQFLWLFFLLIQLH